MSEHPGRKYLHPSILDKIDDKENEVWIDKLQEGTIVEVHTKNSVYKLETLEFGTCRVMAVGGKFVEPQETYMRGSNWGSSMLAIKRIAPGRYMEIGKYITSRIEKIVVIGPNKEFEYELRPQEQED